MSNTLEYVLNLGGNLNERLRRIGLANAQQASTWERVRQQVAAADRTMANMGRSAGSLRERIAALQAQREWIPASNVAAIRQSNREIRALEEQIRRLENLGGAGRLKTWFRDLGQQIPMLNALKNPLTYAALSMYKIKSYVEEGASLYRLQTEGETKLAAVMRNTMNAGADEAGAILKLTSAQQELGVIGDEVQLAGAQELATYLTKKKSLEGLIPVMNDMLAQQYGLNVSQEQAQNVASMLGKVMNGQVGALSRYGYKFDGAQEKILKYGDESQRLAVLTAVVGESVGGVNAALAATPEGKLKQISNAAGDLQERVGRLHGLMSGAFADVALKIQSFVGKVIAFFETRVGGMTSVVSETAGAIVSVFSELGGTVRLARDALSDALSAFKKAFPYLKAAITLIAANAVKVVNLAFSALGATMKIVAGALSALLTGLEWVSPVLLGIAAYLAVVNFNFAVFTARFYAYVAWTKIAALATLSWTKIQAAFNLVMAANPVGLIVAAVVALVAAIAYVAYATDGWGATWDNAMTFMSLSFAGFKEKCALRWLLLKDVFLTGFEVIEKGWYKLKSLWDGEGARQGLARMEAERNARAAEILETRNKILDASDKIAAMTVWEVRSNGKGFDSLLNGLKEKLGVGVGANAQMLSAVNGAGAGALGGSSVGGGSGSSISDSNEAIAAGGKRDTTINISVGDLIREVRFDGGFSENRENLEREMTRCLMRVLGMAETAAG